MNRYDILLQKKPPREIKVRPPKKKPKATKQVSVRAEDAIAELPSPPRRSRLSRRERDRLISTYIRTAAGRARLAASMANPLRERLDYASIARRVLHVDQLPAQFLPAYQVGGTAFVVGENGEYMERISGNRENRVLVPLFDIASNPTIPFSQIRERRYDLIDRAQTTALRDIQGAEENSLLNILSLAGGDDRTITSATLTIEALRGAFRSVSSHDNLRPSNVLMNAREFSVIQSMRGIFTRRRRVPDRYGILVDLWGAPVTVSRSVPVGNVFVLAEPETVGVMPIRTNLTVLAADEPGRGIGWSVFENIGIGCFNPRGVARILVDGHEEVNPLPIRSQSFTPVARHRTPRRNSDSFIDSFVS